MSDPWDNYDPPDDDADYEADLNAGRTQPVAAPRRRKMSDSRGSLYLITGVLMGLVMGVLFAWYLSPVKYVDTNPASLDASYKDEYRRLIALAYAADHDLPRARERIKLVDSGNLAQGLAVQAQRMLADKQSAQDARALAILAADLSRAPTPLGSTPQPGAESTAATPVESTATTDSALVSTLEISAAIQTPTIPLPTPTPSATTTPEPTFTPRPTATPQPVLDAPFSLKSKKEVCNGNFPAGLLEIQVSDAKGNPIPGVRIQVIWQDGEDVFYTGLAPEINPGYADFQLNPGTDYSLKVGDASKAVDGLSMPNCGGGWKVAFVEGKQ